LTTGFVINATARNVQYLGSTTVGIGNTQPRTLPKVAIDSDLLMNSDWRYSYRRVSTGTRADADSGNDTIVPLSTYVAGTE